MQTFTLWVRDSRKSLTWEPVARNLSLEAVQEAYAQAKATRDGKRYTYLSSDIDPNTLED